MEAIEKTLKSRVPDSSGSCSSRDFKFLEPAKEVGWRFRISDHPVHTKISVCPARGSKKKWEKLNLTIAALRLIRPGHCNAKFYVLHGHLFAVFPATSTLMLKSSYGWKTGPKQLWIKLDPLPVRKF